MWRSPHIIVALLVAPVLAVLAYFAASKLVGDTAGPAQRGASYPLLVGANCRRSSGQCQLSNAQLRIDLTMTAYSDAAITLELYASNTFDGVLIGDGTDKATASPFERIAPLRWRVALPHPSDAATLPFVAVADTTAFFAELPTDFLQHRASASR
ncbi:MAG: hypothetical protein AAGC71_12765 [Pseudomonadota bacterium]